MNLNPAKLTHRDDPTVSQWYHDRYATAVISRNRYFVLGLVGIILASIEALAIFFLAPLKSVEPYVIQVDNKSGLTTVLKPLKDENSPNLTQDEAITKSFIVKYIIARETYDPQDLNRNYDLVRLMSSAEETNRFDEFVSDLNPESPVQRYKTATRRTVQISSVSFLDQSKKTAQVRLTTSETQRDQQEKHDYWVAILTYRYVNSPMDEADRFQNPLGFQILSYRLDQEIVP